MGLYRLNHTLVDRVHKNAPVIVKKLVKENMHSKPSKSLQEWAKLGVMKLLHPGFFLKFCGYLAIYILENVKYRLKEK